MIIFLIVVVDCAITLSISLFALSFEQCNVFNLFKLIFKEEENEINSQRVRLLNSLEISIFKCSKSGELFKNIFNISFDNIIENI
ncbi:hypothetical protein C1646_691989 [Rhizophagus diaphanus]|nr:hypothetical protein C1646_691989 [Rhizophagus diaphanus] [Rhizophagus sp. MUCL 43196]